MIRSVSASPPSERAGASTSSSHSVDFDVGGWTIAGGAPAERAVGPPAGDPARAEEPEDPELGRRGEGEGGAGEEGEVDDDADDGDGGDHSREENSKATVSSSRARSTQRRNRIRITYSSETASEPNSLRETAKKLSIGTDEIF